MPVGAQGPGPAEPSSIRDFAASLEMIRDLLSRSRYTEAGNVARALLIRVESLTGPESLEAAAVLDLLGEAARLKPAPGDDPAALADRALAIKERILGPD